MTNKTYKFTTSTTGTPNDKPVAILTATKLDAVAGSIIQLDGRQSFDPEKKTLQYFWRFIQLPIGSEIEASGFRNIRPTGAAVSFVPDKTGIYIVGLTVSDGELTSDPITASVNIQISRVPCGENIIPDANFLWDYISNFWSLVEDRAVIESIWSSTMQVIGAEMIKLWGNDYNKSLSTIQSSFQRRWLRYPTSTSVLADDQRVIVGTSLRGNNGRSGVIGDLVPAVATSIFTVQRFDDLPDFPSLLATTYGAKGRVISINGDGHTINRVSNDTFGITTGTDLAAVVGTDEASSAASDFVALDVRAGDSIKITGTGTFVIREVTPTLLRLDDALGVPAVLPTLLLASFTVNRSASLAVMDEESLVGGVVGASWHIPNLLHIPGVDLEAAGVRRGDVIVFEATRGDVGLVGELRAQVICVDRKRVGFEFNLADLTDLTTPLSDRSQFSQLVRDLRIVPTQASDDEADAAANTLMSFFPIGVNLSNRPFSRFQVTLKANRIIHNTVVSINADIVSIPALQETPKDPPIVLRENLDYVVESGAITFISGLFTPEDPAPSEFWAECSLIDNAGVIESNFGRLVNLLRDDLSQRRTRAPYLSAVKGLIFAYTNGPSIANLRLGLQILLGLPFTEERGEILENQDNFTVDSSGSSLGRLLIEDVDNNNRRTGFRRVYFYPSAVGLEEDQILGRAYKIGDVVEQFVPLSKGIEVQDYVKDPLWWQRALQGLEVLKFFTFKILISSDIFDSNDVQFAFDFINAIKPDYTKVITTALLLLEDDINVTDLVSGGVTLNFYDNTWGLEATRRTNDRNQQGAILWRAGSRPFHTRTQKMLRDVQTKNQGGFVHVLSSAGWDQSQIQSRSASAAWHPAVEGDLVQIYADQLGVGLYEIASILSPNELRLLQAAPLTNPTTFSVSALSAALFEYGTQLRGGILRRMTNPLVYGSDLSTNADEAFVTPATVNFNDIGVSPGDILIIELEGSSGTQVNGGEYIIEAITPFSAGPPLVPPSINDDRFRILNLNGTPATTSVLAGQDYRIVRPSLRPPMFNIGKSIYNSGLTRMELWALDPQTLAAEFDVFTPGMVGQTIEVANSQNPINDGQFTVTAYLSHASVVINNPSVASDTGTPQAKVYL